MCPFRHCFLNTYKVYSFLCSGLRGLEITKNMIFGLTEGRVKDILPSQLLIVGYKNLSILHLLDLFYIMLI